MTGAVEDRQESGGMRRAVLDRASRLVPGVAALGGAEAARRDVDAVRRAARSSGGFLDLAAAITRSIPDVARLLVSLAKDERVALRRRLALFAIVPYLVSPIDLVPDFLPGIGGMDDALVVLLVLRWVLRGSGGNWLVWNVTRKMERHARALGVLVEPAVDPATDPTGDQ